MSPLQRSAWWSIACALAACAAVACAWPWLGFPSMGFFGLLGFSAVGGLFLRRPGFRATLDERDREIAQAANHTALRAAYLFFIAGIGTMMMVFDRGATVPGKWINLVLWTGFAVVMFVQGVATLWHYRKDENHAPSA